MPNRVICHVTLDKVHVLILSNKKMAHDGAQFDISLVSSKLESIQRLTGDLLYSRFQKICSDKWPGEDFIAKLNTSEWDTVYKCCLLLSTATNGKKIPHIFQLLAVLDLLAHKDCLIDTGTGSGKTLCMVLPALLDPTAVALVVSPLKRLQVLQVSCISVIVDHF